MVDQRRVSSTYRVDSAGIGNWHDGELADPRMRRTALRHNIKLDGRARQFKIEDFDRFDLVVAMDRRNRDDLLRLARTESDRHKIHLMREYDIEAAGNFDVPDPYYSGSRGFENVYQIVRRASQTLLHSLEKM